MVPNSAQASTEENIPEITPEFFPEDPKHEDIWVCWRYEETKMLKIAGTKRNAASNDPGTWSSFSKAFEAYKANPDYYAGIGMVFQDDDPFIGIDLDGCRNAETGQIAGWALEIIKAADTYTEVSPSRDGVKMWAAGHIPHRSYSKKFDPGSKPGIEIYSGGRWFAVTGWHLGGTPLTINRRTSQITKLAKKEFPEKFQVHEASQARAESPGSNSHREAKDFDLETWIEKYGVPITSEAPDTQGRKWRLAECPRSDRHSTPDPSGAYVGQMNGAGTPHGAIYARCSHAGCFGGDLDLWHDLRRKFEPGWEPYEPKNVGFSRNGGGDSSDGCDSFSYTNDFIQPLEFPVDALPKSVGRFVREAANSLMCPAELVAVPALCTLSAAVGHSRALRIKPDWVVSASLYAAVVDTPGSRKSPAAAFAYKPLEKLQGELRKDYKEEKKTYEQDMRQHAVDKKLAAKQDKPEPEPPPQPTMKRCIIDDSTLEALVVRLQENPRGLLSAHDELTGLLRGMDQYKSGGKGNARQAYLKMWSNQPIMVDRKGGDEPIVVPRPFLTVSGAIQPGVLNEIAAGRDDGFLDRWIFGYPDSKQGGYSDACISAEAGFAYEQTIRALWNKQPQEASEDEYEATIVLMSREAKELFKASANELQAEMFAPGFPEVMRGAWAKFDLHLARLALILSLARQVDKAHEEVSVEDMRNALSLLDYFKNTARKVYGQLFEANPDDVLAASLMTVLTEAGYKFFGTISLLMEKLDSRALPDSPESMGHALRRIAKKTPGLSLEIKRRGTGRFISLSLEKPSQPSQPSPEETTKEDEEMEVGV